jgi:hypothetical protein
MARGRNDAQLHHHSEHVHQDSSRDDLLSSESVNHHAPHCDWAVRRRNAEELALMRGGPHEPAQYLVALRNLLIDRPLRIRKRRSNADQCLLESIQSRTLAWEGHLLDHVALEIFAGRFDVASSENTVNEFTNTSLVPVGHVHLSQESRGQYILATGASVSKV